MRIDEEYKLSKTIDLELTRAEVEVLELEARLRVVPMNDTQLSDALKTALAAKKDRLAKLRTLRSEEHTSELQSQSNLVCRLLLEKKNRHSVLHGLPRGGHARADPHLLQYALQTHRERTYPLCARSQIPYDIVQLHADSVHLCERC